MPGAVPADIAKVCTQEISAQEVRKSLQFLEHKGFLKQVDENVYKQTEKSVQGSKEGLPIAIRSMNRQMGYLAIDSLSTHSLSVVLILFPKFPGYVFPTFLI